MSLRQIRSANRTRWTALLLAGIGCIFGGSPATAEEAKPVDCPLVVRIPRQKALLILDGGSELAPGQAACRRARLDYVLGAFDDARTDYSEFHLIVVGSNQMDHWGHTPERQRPEAFLPLERFVRAGGHLLVFGTFNARNCEQLARFGISTGFYHTREYERVPALTDILFTGSEAIIPKGTFLQQAGNFAVSRPHVVMVRRGPGSEQGASCLSTIPFDRGRVTFTTVEPTYGEGFWFMDAVIHWASRGAPVVAGATDPIVDDLRRPLPERAKLEEAEKKVRTALGDKLSAEATPAERRAEAKTMEAAALEETDPAMRSVLMKLAIDNLVAAGDAEPAFQAFDRWTNEFAVARPAGTLDLLREFMKQTRTAKLREVCFQRALLPVDESLRLRDIKTAEELVGVATEMGQSGRNRRWIALAAAEAKFIEQVTPLITQVTTALGNDKPSPDNPVHQRVLGEFYAFGVRDWPRGLEHLTRCDHEALKTVALKDLGQPAAAADREALGDAWLAVAKSSSALQKSAAEQRAASWYSRAVVDLTGLRKAAVQKKLKDLAGPAFSLKIQSPRVPARARLVITPEEISWQEGGLKNPPERVTLGDYLWTPAPETPLSNLGSQRIIPRNIHFTSAHLEKVRTTGFLELVEATADRIVLEFRHGGADRPAYDFTLAFGP